MTTWEWETGVWEAKLLIGKLCCSRLPIELRSYVGSFLMRATEVSESGFAGSNVLGMTWVEFYLARVLLFDADEVSPCAAAFLTLFFVELYWF